MTTRSENRLLPMSAIVAMLVVSSTIVGLAYWVGDSIAPDSRASVAVSTAAAADAGPLRPRWRGMRVRKFPTELRGR